MASRLGPRGGPESRAAAIRLQGDAPRRPALVLTALIAAAAVANLNLSLATVSLPAIDRSLKASQTELNLVAVGFVLGLAGSVLYAGALSDRFGRRRMLILGLALCLPASLIAGLAPNVTILILARILGGVAAGMALPTTLSLITALWSGAGRTRAIALWSGIGAGISALGPLVAGAILEVAPWGLVFISTVPLAGGALVLTFLAIPTGANENTQRVDHLGGVLSVVAFSSLILAIGFSTLPGSTVITVVAALLAAGSGVAFILRQLRAANPLVDLAVASRRVFWVASVTGAVLFGGLVGVFYIGELSLQYVLHCSALQAGLAALPCVVLLMAMAPVSSALTNRFGSKAVLLIGMGFCIVGLAIMTVLWEESTAFADVLIVYCLIGIGVGLAGPPVSEALVNSVPVSRAGLASSTVDLQRNLGAAVFQSILGLILTLEYASTIRSSLGNAPGSVLEEIGDPIAAELQRSFQGAGVIAEQYPPHSGVIVAAARYSYDHGVDLAELIGTLILLGGWLFVLIAFPGRDRERLLLERYRASDTAAAARRDSASRPPAPE